MKTAANLRSVILVLLGVAAEPVRSNQVTTSPSISAAPSVNPTNTPTASLSPSLVPSFEPSTAYPSSNPTAQPSSPPSSSPSDEPTKGPTQVPSDTPTASPTPESDLATTNGPTSHNTDIWSIVRNEGAQAQVLVGQEPKLFASVEMQYILYNASQANNVEVFLYPYEKCGDGDPTLLGSFEICDDCASNTNTILIDDQVIIDANFTMDDLTAFEGTLWNQTAKTVQFCARVALYETNANMLVSYHDTNVELLVDLTTGFTAVNMDSTASNPNSLIRSYSYEVASCLCQETTNECYSTLPLFQMGSSVRVCIFPPLDQNVEIEKIVELELRQEGTNVTRYAFLNGVPDGLSSVETATADVLALRTALDARFFEVPEKVSVFGFVLMKPMSKSRGLRDRATSKIDSPRRLEPASNDEGFEEETGVFRLVFELLSEDEMTSSNQPWKLAFAAVVVAASLLAAVLVWQHLRGRKTIDPSLMEASRLV